MINDHDCTLEFLPPYSPDLNPIEHKWAHAKAIRKQYHCNVDDLLCVHMKYDTLFQNSYSVLEAANSLGIRSNLLYRWKDKIDEKAAETALAEYKRIELPYLVSLFKRYTSP